MTGCGSKHKKEYLNKPQVILLVSLEEGTILGGVMNFEPSKHWNVLAIISCISSSTWIGKLVRFLVVCSAVQQFLQLPSTIEPVNSSLWSASKRHTPHEPENSKIHLHLAVASSEFERLPHHHVVSLYVGGV